MSFLPTYIYFIAVSFIASLSVFFIRKDNFSYLKFFAPFLMLTILAEAYCSYLWSNDKNNVELYNFFSTFEFCFYVFIISMLIKNARMRKIMRLSIIFYIPLATINILFIQGITRFHTITYSLGCLLVVSFCIYYFFELFRFPQSEKIIYNPAFWICSGLLFFYCCGFPLYGLINIWSDISKLVVQNFDKIVTILNIFLYTLFTIAFLCSRKKKYTLSP
jgi:hypothetical protein